MSSAAGSGRRSSSKRRSHHREPSGVVGTCCPSRSPLRSYLPVRTGDVELAKFELGSERA